MIAFEGVPAIYFNSMFGTSNDEAKFVITGNNRDVNRYKWNLKIITSKLSNKVCKESYLYKHTFMTFPPPKTCALRKSKE